MVSPKKTPTRMCLGCQQLRSKRELIRIVRSPEGEFSLDLTGKKSGREAYICKNVECFNKAVKEHRFEKSFKSVIDEKIYDELRTGIFNADK